MLTEIDKLKHKFESPVPGPDPKPYLKELESALRSRFDRLSRNYTIGKVEFVGFYNGKTGVKPSEPDYLAKFKYQVDMKKPTNKSEVQDAYIVFNTHNKLKIRDVLVYCEFDDAFELSANLEKRVMAAPVKYKKPTMEKHTPTKTTSKKLKSVSSNSSNSVIKEVSKNGANIKIGTKLVVTIDGKPTNGTIDEPWALNDDDDKFSISFKDSNGEGRYAYLYQVRTLDGKPISSYKELEKFKNKS